MRVIVWVMALAAICVGYFRLWPVIVQTDQARYRLTVEIDTPDGLRKGSGVWGYSMAPNFDVPVFSMQWYFSPRIEGEAIPVDLGKGRLVYMILGGRVMPENQGGGIEPASFNSGFLNDMPGIQLWSGGLGSPVHGFDHAGAKREIEWIKAKAGKVVTLDCVPVPHHNSSGYCPALVLLDPTSRHVQMLDPADLAWTLGPGYRLRDVTLEVVNDPVTRGIERRLPWVHPASRREAAAGFTISERDILAAGFSRHDPAYWPY